MSKRQAEVANDGNCDSSSCGCGPLGRREFVQVMGLGAAALTPIAGAAASAASNTGLDANGRYEKRQDRDYNGSYTGKYLDRVAFPIGGLGSGMFCLEGTGAISHVSMRNEMEAFNAPNCFAALCIKGQDGNVAKVLEGQVPEWKMFGRPGTGNGAGQSSAGFPRFENAEFVARFPFAEIELSDEEMPLDVKITGWNPFTPGDADNSSLPVGALEYTFTNNTDKPVECVFSYNSANFMAAGDSGASIKAFPQGFLLSQSPTATREDLQGDCAIYTDRPETVVDHCWFRGGWFDSLTLAWENIANARLLENPPVGGGGRGASLFVPLTVAPGDSETVRLMFTWYVPNTRLRSGESAAGSDPAFAAGPAQGTASGQNPVSGYAGKGLVNTFHPSGDAAVGTLTSPEFTIQRNHLQFLIGGGNNSRNTVLQLLVEGKPVRTATGKDTEQLEWESWNVSDWRGKPAQLKIVDNATGGWGHINVDHIVQTDKVAKSKADLTDAILIADFEGKDFGDWVATGPDKKPESAPVAQHHTPWYAGRFDSVEQTADYWKQNYDELRTASKRFSDAFYDTTLPPEVVEAVAANLTILKSPTVLRQADGRMWCWEGCSDSRGCCSGSCTHVWNYAQAMCHLFPDMERSLRQTEFHESQSPEGHQTFRSALPIRPVAHNYHAASDGQLGGILKVYREWRISADTDWLRDMWPQAQQSLDYCIHSWDPRHKGVLEEPHHNTYDIEYWGPDGHCGSFYLSALAAAAAMGRELGKDVSLYEELVEKGTQFLEEELYDGEYFFHKIQVDGLDAKFRPITSSNNGEGYSELIEDLNQQGPKYQYGTGCLSDGVLGFWMAEVCGVEPTIDREKLRSNLKAIHKYNFKPSLMDHANPQRPTYAFGSEGGLLLCSWPKGGELSIPFVYSNEVWTGIEYQAASHMMMEGMVDEGLDIVRACRDRYDGRVRNPFNEFECGHWYARAMSSYALLQGLTGVRYDAIDKTLFVDSQVGDFRSFLSTATGYGTVEMKDGKVSLDVRHGEIPVDQVVVAGKTTKLSS